MADKVEDGEKLFSSARNADVKSPEAAKFIPTSENKNGISPISVDSMKATFTGLTKEELMKYANDPFWVRTRLFLFVLFWIVWLSMLLGAIYIIVVTPKCKEDPPPVWWQKSPMYIVDVAKLIRDNPSPEKHFILGILKNRIDYLEHLGVESLLLGNVLESSVNAFDQVTNFTQVNRYLSSIDEFQSEIIDYARSKGINIILSFVPNHSGSSSDSFVRSKMGEEDYKEMYVWFPIKYQRKPEFLPNNWLSVYNGSAWEWNDRRGQFYLHQFNVTQPDFNFTNPAVVEYFSNVLKFWLDHGIRGFHLDKAEYLVEDRNFKNETLSWEPGYTPQEYGFYRHLSTSNLEETTNIIKNWSLLIRSHSGVLGVSDGVRREKNVVDFVTRPVSLPSNFDAVKLNSTIAKFNSEKVVKQPLWKWKCSVDDSAACFPPSIQGSMSIVSFLLPGIPVLESDDEFYSNNASNSFSSLSSDGAKKPIKSESAADSDRIKRLIELRALPAFTYGTFQSDVLNGTVFAFTRFKQGTPGHLVAWNIGTHEKMASFQSFSIVPEDLLVVFKSNHSFQEAYDLKSRVKSSDVILPPMAAIVFSFVPSTK